MRLKIQSNVVKKKVATKMKTQHAVKSQENNCQTTSTAVTRCCHGRVRGHEIPMSCSIA